MDPRCIPKWIFDYQAADDELDFFGYWWPSAQILPPFAGDDAEPALLFPAFDGFGLNDFQAALPAVPNG